MANKFGKIQNRTYCVCPSQPVLQVDSCHGVNNFVVVIVGKTAQDPCRKTNHKRNPHFCRHQQHGHRCNTIDEEKDNVRFNTSVKIFFDVPLILQGREDYFIDYSSRADTGRC